MSTLPIIGLILIGIFVIYLTRQLNNNIYIRNLDYGKDENRTKIIHITTDNKVTEKGTPVLSKFDPLTIDINIGDTIKFINKDVLRHSIEIHNNNIQNSKILLPNDTFMIPINVSDDVIYSSSLYPKMEKGTIYVQSNNENKNVGKIQKNIIQLKYLTDNISNNVTKRVKTSFSFAYDKLSNGKQLIDNFLNNIFSVFTKTYNQFTQIVNKMFTNFKYVLIVLIILASILLFLVFVSIIHTDKYNVDLYHKYEKILI